MTENQSSQPQDQKPANETADAAKSAKKEIEDGKVMAILSYIFAPIPYFAEKDNKFVRYHAVQGMNFFIIVVAYAVLASIINRMVWSVTVNSCINSLGSCSGGFAEFFSWILSLVGLGIAVIAIIGIINAAQGKKEELPFLGKVKIVTK